MRTLRTLGLYALISAASAGFALGQAPATPPPAHEPQQKPAAAQPPQPKPAPPAVREEARPSAPRPDNFDTLAIPLQHAEAAGVCRTLQQILGGEARIVSDDRTNSILVTADRSQTLPLLRTLVETLDREVDSGGGRNGETVKCLRLEKASAREVAAQVMDLMGKRGTRVVSDKDSNSIWLSGFEADVERFLQVAREMDVSTVTTQSHNASRELRFYSLKDADAGALTGTLSRTADMLALDVELVPDVPSGTVIAYASSASHERLSQIIAALDVPARARARSQPTPPAAAPSAEPRPVPSPEAPRKS